MSEITETIDKLTKSIENAITGQSLYTDVLPASIAEVKAEDWVFDWRKEIECKGQHVFKLVTRKKELIIHGLICLTDAKDHIIVNLVESAKFNKGADKQYLGVAGNLFAFACKYSFESGYSGYVAFDSKTALKQHYRQTLGAKILFGNRMIIETKEARELIKRYFNEPVVHLDRVIQVFRSTINFTD